MSRKYIFVLTLLLFAFMTAHTQNIELTLHDLIPGGNTYNKYQPKMPKSLRWHKDKLLHIKGDSVVSLPLHESDESIVFFTKEDINNILDSLKKPQINDLTKIKFPIENQPFILVKAGESSILYDFEKNTYTQITIPQKAQNLDINTTTNQVAYTVGNSLNIQTSPSNLIALLGNSSDNQHIVFGQAVHRNEFGINKGIFWSPKGNLLAFYKMDESMVTDYPLVDISTPTASLKNIKYPMTGMKSHEVEVGILNCKTGKIIYLNTGQPKDKYLTNITWSPDEHSIYIAELNRKQDTCRLNRYNAQNGNLEFTVFEETHSKYVEPENPIIFLKNNPDKFIWLSKRDGYNHAYLYNIDGKLLKQLTNGKWDIISICGFDNNGNIIYTSTEESPIEQHIYSLNIATTKRLKLSKEQGVHNVSINESGQYLYDIYTSQDNCGTIAVVNLSNNDTSIVFEAENPYNKTTLPEIILGKITANDGRTDLYFRLTKPVGFDETKKYPTIIYVYGGPHSQMITNSWMGAVRGWDIYMAQKGYLVFTLDNRGTSNRGLDFENITHRQLGITETQDQISGFEYLKSLPYVDTSRIGVHGWSFGGFMTLNLMLRHPDKFKVGVAGGSVTDWKYYEIMYGERYMGTPQDNPEGYKETSMLNKAENLQGKLLLIHGDEDPVVVMQHSLQFLKESIKAGTHPDFFIYPGHKHNMDGVDRIHLHEHISQYFDDHLK